MNDRVLWVDAVKGVGIVVVVFGHVWRGLSEAGLINDQALFHAVDSAIYLFHMPLFFLVSGLFFERSVRRDGFAVSLVKRAETLLVPLLLWSWITAACLIVAGSLTNRPPISVVDALLYPFPPKDIFWFLWALFLIQTAASLLVGLRSTYVVATFVAAMAIVLTLGMGSFPHLLRQAVENLPFFMLGVALARWGKFPRLLANATGPVALVFFGACEAFAIWNWVPAGTASGYVLALFAVVSFCAAIAWLTDTVPQRLVTWVSYLGVASIAIYVSHIMPLAAARILMVKLGVESLAAHLIIGVVAGIVPATFGYFLLRKWGYLRWLGLGKGPQAGQRTQPSGAAPEPAKYPWPS